VAYANVEKRQERKLIAKEMSALVERGLSTSEQQERFNRLDLAQKKLQTEIESLEGHPPQSSHFGGGDVEEAGGDVKYRSTYDKYLRRGIDHLDSAEQAVLKQKANFRATFGVEGGPTGGAYPGSTAGFIVPVGFVNQIEAATLFAGDMLRPGFCNIVKTELGGPLPFPTANDTSISAEIVGENDAVSTQNVTTGIVNLGAFKYSTKVILLSLEVLQDTTIPVDSFLARTMGERLGRKLNSDFLVGTGSGEPTGVITAMTAASAPTVTAVGSTTNDSVGGANTIGSDDITNLMHKLDVSYRGGASFLMHDSTLSALQKVKDKYGRPLWTPGIAVGQPDTLFGKRFYINNYMAGLQTSASSPAVTNTAVLFGDFSKFTIRSVHDLFIMRLVELYAANGQVGYLGFARYDSNLLDAGTHPLVSLVTTY
jgi:HK97 family phage major capsid protein